MTETVEDTPAAAARLATVAHVPPRPSLWLAWPGGWSCEPKSAAGTALPRTIRTKQQHSQNLAGHPATQVHPGDPSRVLSTGSAGSDTHYLQNVNFPTAHPRRTPGAPFIGSPALGPLAPLRFIAVECWFGRMNRRRTPTYGRTEEVSTRAPIKSLIFLDCFRYSFARAALWGVCISSVVV